MKEEKLALVVHWWEDAYGVHTCHRNEPGLSFKDSLLGELYFVQDTEGIVWYLTLFDTVEDHGPYKTVQEARRALESLAGGAPIDTWK